MGRLVAKGKKVDATAQGEGHGQPGDHDGKGKAKLRPRYRRQPTQPKGEPIGHEVRANRDDDVRDRREERRDRDAREHERGARDASPPRHEGHQQCREKRARKRHGLARWHREREDKARDKHRKSRACIDAHDARGREPITQRSLKQQSRDGKRRAADEGRDKTRKTQLPHDGNRRPRHRLGPQEGRKGVWGRERGRARKDEAQRHKQEHSHASHEREDHATPV